MRTIGISITYRDSNREGWGNVSVQRLSVSPYGKEKLRLKFEGESSNSKLRDASFTLSRATAAAVASVLTAVAQGDAEESTVEFKPPKGTTK